MNIAARFWDKQAAGFDANEKLDHLRARTTENTRKYLNAGDVVLDYGCGTGIMACAIADHVQRVQGIDISSKMLEIAKAKAAEHGSNNIEFSQATIFDKSLKSESFDVVLAMGILHLLSSRKKVVQRIHQLLKPGGWFISSTACIGDNQPIMSLINRLFFIPSLIGLLPNVRFFRVPELEHLISTEEFQIAEAESLSFGSEPPDQSYVFIRFVVAKRL